MGTNVGSMRIKCKYCGKISEITASNIEDRVKNHSIKCPICRKQDCLKLNVLSEKELEVHEVSEVRFHN